jgi:glucosamine-phosphate N-acetyltransferase
MALLDQLSVHHVDLNKTSDLFDIYQQDYNHTILVLGVGGEIVATGAVLFEQKIRGNIAAHIEDVVTSSSCRGKGFGRIVIDALVDLAVERKCYKVILDCSKKNISFYEKCGFKLVENCMRKDLI